MRLWNAFDHISSKPDTRSSRRSRLSAGWPLLVVMLLMAWPPSASARVHSSILVDVQTGKVLEAHNADARCYPASLAKLMTLYITFQQLNTGKMTLSQELPVSRHAAAQQPTKLYLHPGQRISVRSAILAITTKSANDAAVVLAEAIAGSEWKFAELMTHRARELGLTRTTFRNASGLPNRRQKTTARDMSKLALAILEDFPQYYHFFSARCFDFHGTTVYGHDHLLARYQGVDGMKTGYTRASGFNIVTSAIRHGHRLLGVVMGGRTAYSRDRLMTALLNRGFAHIPSGPERAAAAETEPAVHHTARYVPVSDQGPGEDQDDQPESTWIVQIGGTFHSAHQVRSALRSASNTLPRRLDDATPLVVKLRGRRYLARFSDMRHDTALEVCHILRRRRFTCKAFENPSSSSVIASAN